jgi:hypothetical protein
MRAILAPVRKPLDIGKCVVVDAVVLEPVSGANLVVNRENNSEFGRIRA